VAWCGTQEELPELAQCLPDHQTPSNSTPNGVRTQAGNRAQLPGATLLVPLHVLAGHQTVRGVPLGWPTSTSAMPADALSFRLAPRLPFCLRGYRWDTANQEDVAIFHRMARQFLSQLNGSN
jgi:hypothetical protein